ncbi:MAG: AMP-binding protein [Rhodothermia bacterium]|nr:MAG: AMP-binding protein [Rhodothermia bacterium]
MSEPTDSNRAGAETSFPFGQEVVWRPDPIDLEETNLMSFMVRHGFDSLNSLHERSVGDPEWFWDAVLKDLDIQFYEPYKAALERTNDPAFPRWCVGGQMNIVQNCLDKWLSGETANVTAFRWEGEDGTTVVLSYAELNDRVSRCANALLSIGVQKGDVIGLFMPMTPELVAAFLAICKIGAVLLPLFSGYGPQAIATRLNDAGASTVITADGFVRRGNEVAMKRVLDSALENCPLVTRVLVNRQINVSDTPWTEGRDLWWDEIVPEQSSVAKTVRTSAEDVVMIIYTSGTTGRPKGAVHTHCGFPVKAAQDMAHAMDLRPGEMMYWMSDMGWMMGPWLVFGTLLCGAGMLFYDGAPDYPDVGRLWRLVENHRVTHLGISPVLIRAIMPHGTEPLSGSTFDHLRAVGSTGSPWDPESWKWVFENVLESSKPILNYSGGTEISGGILSGNMFTPLKPCAFSGPVPGMAADVVNDSGDSVQMEVGELVIRGPWIGMTRGFWNDSERYLDSYWRRFEGVWVHGDFAAIDEDGLWYILGRSDDTIKVAGKRVGPAEVEAILNSHPDVTESAAIGIPHELKGETLAIYCVVSNASKATDEFRSELIELVTRELGKPLKPGFLGFAAALPKTRNAKVIRRLIKAAHLDKDLGDTSSLENPRTIEAIRNAT